MLTHRTLFRGDRLTLADVACRHRRGRGRQAGGRAGHGLVSVRRGCFVRSVDGREGLFEPTLAYGVNPGDHERYDHPHGQGDDCTWLGLDAEVAAELWGGDPHLPPRPLPTAPAIDLEHRLLLAAAARGADRHELAERALGLAPAE